MKSGKMKIAIITLVMVVLGFLILINSPYRCILIKPQYATIIETYNGVHVYYNGNNPGKNLRSTSADGYNLGLKYQCVEFVKRYYYERLNHKMPESYGHAKSFINPTLQDGGLNKQRNLIQHLNGSTVAPKQDDILVFGPSRFNEYGHVAIVVSFNQGRLTVVQQNVGCRTRDKFNVIKKKNGYWVENDRVLGWLRKP